MSLDWLWKVGTALIAGAMLLFGIGRFVGNVEQRLNDLERKQQYLHGTVMVPGDKE